MLGVFLIEVVHRKGKELCPHLESKQTVPRFFTKPSRLSTSVSAQGTG